jgi:hypothetical protein
MFIVSSFEWRETCFRRSEKLRPCVRVVVVMAGRVGRAAETSSFHSSNYGHLHTDKTGAKHNCTGAK